MHLEARPPELLDAALAWRVSPAPRPLVRGDELRGALGVAHGPLVGELLEALAEARYAGELHTREEAVARARELLETH